MATAASAVPGGSVDLALEGCTVIVAEVARWIALLLSPVSSFMTGAVIPLDGGQVIPHA